MLFMLLSSFFILSGASETRSLQPVGKIEEHNASAPDLMSVLASKGNPDVLLKMVENADPDKVGGIIVLLEELLADTEENLEALTTASTNANSAYDSADSAHSAAVDAQTEGVANLAQDVADSLQAQTEGEAKLAQDVADSEQAQTEETQALELDVQGALAAKEQALGAKTVAQAALDDDEERLLLEIDHLKEVITALEALATPPAEEYKLAAKLSTCEQGTSIIATSDECQKAAGVLGIKWNGCCQNINNEQYGCQFRSGIKWKGPEYKQDVLFNGNINSKTARGSNGNRQEVCK